MAIVISNADELKQYNITRASYGEKKYHFPDDVVINFPVPKDSVILADKNVQIMAVDSTGVSINKTKIYSKNGDVTFTGDVSKVEVVALNGAVNFTKIGDSAIYAKSVTGQDIIKAGLFSSAIYAEESVGVNSLLAVEVRCKGEVNCKVDIPKSRGLDSATVYAAKFNGKDVPDQGRSFGEPLNKFDGSAKITYDVNVGGKKSESEREFGSIPGIKAAAPARQAEAAATRALDEAFKLIDARLRAWGDDDRTTMVTQADQAVREGVSKEDFIKGRDEKREVFKQELGAQLDKVVAIYELATDDVKESAEKRIGLQREHISKMVYLGKEYEQGYYELAEQLVARERDLAAMQEGLNSGAGQNADVTRQMKELLEGLRVGSDSLRPPASSEKVPPVPVIIAPSVPAPQSFEVNFELVDSLGRCGRDPRVVSSQSILVIGRNAEGKIGVYNVAENNLPESNSPLKAGIRLKGVFDSESVIINRDGQASIGYQQDGVLVEFDQSLFSSLMQAEDSSCPNVARPTLSERFTLEMKIPGPRKEPMGTPKLMDPDIFPTPEEQNAEFIARGSDGGLYRIMVKESDATGIKSGSECRNVEVVGQKLGKVSMEFTSNGTTYTAGPYRYTELTPTVIKSVNEVQQGGKSAQVSFDR